MYKHKGFYNGRLNAGQERRLINNRRELVEQLNNKEIINLMFSKNVLNAFDKFKIDELSSSTEQNTTMVDILLKKTPEAYQVFLQLLQDTGQSDLYDLLCFDDGDTEPAESEANQDKAESEENVIVVATPSEAPCATEALLSPGSAAPPGDQHLHIKLTSLEERVDNLAGCVGGLQTQLDQALTTARKSDEKREARHEELKKELMTRETLLQHAVRQIDSLSSKINKIQEEKVQAMDKANKELQRMNLELIDQKEEKKRLEETVRQLTEENEALKIEIEKITQEKALVQEELAKQEKRMSAVERENKQLKKKVSDNEQTLQLVVNKVETLQMTFEADNCKQRRVRTCASSKGGNRADPHPKRTLIRCRTAQPRPRGTDTAQPAAEPKYQTTAKPNSKRN